MSKHNPKQDLARRHKSRVKKIKRIVSVGRRDRIKTLSRTKKKK